MAELILFSMAVAYGAPVPKERPVETHVTITPTTRTIKEGDPLIVLATLRCGTDAELTVKEAFSFTWNAVHAEVRPPDGEKYRQVLIGNQGGICGFSHPLKLSKGARARCFGVLYADGQQPVFNAVGKWQIRVRVRCESGDLVSEPVEITVEERDKKGRRTAKACFDDLRSLLSGGGSDGVLTSLKAALPDLTGSNAHDAITRTLLLVDLNSASGAKEVEKATKVVDEYRKKLKPLEQEYLDLRIAKMYLNKKDIQSTETVLSRIAESSEELKGIKAVLSERQKNEALRK